MNNEELIEKDLNELYSILGTYVGASAGMASQNDDDNRKLGESWFRINREKLGRMVCGNAVVIAIRQDKDEVKALNAIADIIASTVVAIPPFVVSALILKIGFDKFCQNTDTP